MKTISAHSAVRILTVAAMIAITVRFSQLRMKSGHWAAIVPEPLILLFVLVGLLFAPILCLVNLMNTSRQLSRIPFWTDFAFILTLYLFFIVYVRYG